MSLTLATEETFDDLLSQPGPILAVDYSEWDTGYRKIRPAIEEAALSQKSSRAETLGCVIRDIVKALPEHRGWPVAICWITSDFTGCRTCDGQSVLKGDSLASNLGRSLFLVSDSG